MTSINRVRMVWSGFPGGPGVTTLYTLDTSAFLSDLFNFMYAIRARIPDNVLITPEATGDVINDVTGELTGSWTESSVGTIDCTGTGVYSAPSGCVVDWMTSTILDGRRLRGRSFLVPLAGSQYQDDGTLDETARSEIESLSSAFVENEAGAFVVWHRPRDARAADGSRPAVTARAGGHGLVTASRVTDMASVLRSRRD